MKEPEKKSLAKFLRGKGFYIVLSLCVIAIGVTGYLMFFTPQNSIDSTLASNGQTKTAITTGGQVASVVLPSVKPVSGNVTKGYYGDTTVVSNPIGNIPTPMPSTTPMPSVSPSPNPTKPTSSSQTNSSTNEQVFFVRPLPGNELEEFSNVQLVFNPTTDDWRTHDGIDISASVGTDVHAIADGKVVKVYNDSMYGVTVVINSADSYESVYSNLMTGVSVKVGDEVKAGNVIGAVGNTAIIEALEKPHLHIAVLQNGIYVNPDSVLPKAAN